MGSCTSTNSGEVKEPHNIDEELHTAVENWQNAGLERREGSIMQPKKNFLFDAPFGAPHLERSGKSFFHEGSISTIFEYVSSVKGKKPHPNEDRYLLCNSLGRFMNKLPSDFNINEKVSSKLELMRLYAIADGHGGSACAKYIIDNLVTKLVETRWLDDEITTESTCSALEAAFLNIEADYLKLCLETNDSSGAVVVVAIEYDGWLYVSNIGDCEALVLDHRGRKLKMTTLHSSKDNEELSRVLKTGAKVHNGYIMNKLQPSRTIGDSDIKQITKCVILAKPVTHVLHLKKLEEGTGPCLILGCDGFWDIGREKAATFISKHTDFWMKCKKDGNMKKYNDAGYIDPAKAMVEYAQKSQSRDDITTIFVSF